METPKVTQLDLFDEEGNPVAQSIEQENKINSPVEESKKETPTVLMTSEEREEWKSNEPEGEHQHSWQDIHNK